MSDCFVQKPYALSESDIFIRNVTDFGLFITSPVWLPIAGVCIGTHLLYTAFENKIFRSVCSHFARLYLGHATVVDIGTKYSASYLLWKTKDTTFVVILCKHLIQDVVGPCTSIICDTWNANSSYVVTTIDNVSRLDQRLIRLMEEYTVSSSDDDRDTILVLGNKLHNIENHVTSSMLADGYYGIMGNKFNIVYS